MEQKKPSLQAIISTISIMFGIIGSTLGAYSKIDRKLVQVDANTKNIEKLVESVEDLKESVTILVTKMENINK